MAPAACSILGGPGDDILVGSPFNDVLCGLGGDDEINGNGGDDVLVGGPGDDKLNGEAGEDCLLAGAGDDEVRTDRRREPVAGERRRRHPRAFVSPDGSCYRAVPKNGRTTFELVAGPVRGPVQTGAFFIALGRLAAAARQGDVDPFGVSLPKRTLFRDGLLRQLLLCPTTVSGRLVYRTRDGRLVARTRFTCTPQSELVRISLSPSVRRRLEVAGRLKVNVRVTIGDDVQSFSITLRVA